MGWLPFHPSAAAAIRKVPDQYSFIQDAIDAASYEDTISVTILRFAFDISPNQLNPRGRLPHIEVLDVLNNDKIDRYLSIFFKRWRNLAELEYIVEASNDLRHWEAISDYQVEGNPEDAGGGAQYVVYRDIPPDVTRGFRAARSE